MWYQEFINTAKDITIKQTDHGLWYLDPDWHTIIADEIEDNLFSLTYSYITTWEQVEDVLKLEVERRNLIRDNKHLIVDWLYDLITTTVEPAMLKEETDYINKVIEFMKASHNAEVPAENVVPAETTEETNEETSDK